MAVDNQHNQYKNMAQKWKRCRDAACGQEAVHGAGTAYLPQLSGQSTAEYAAYKLRATFYNATWRTLSGLQSMLFRKPAFIKVPPVAEKLLDDVSLSGEPLHMFSLEVVEECLMVGRVGVFVDYPTVDTSTTTAADAKRQNLRPTLKRYVAESIINWNTSVVNNACVLSLVVLAEEVETAKESSEFEYECKTQYRVLDLATLVADNGDTSRAYRVRVFTIDEKTKEDILVSTAIPMLNGKTLDYIPFYFIGVDSVSPEVDEPPMIDLVDVNLSHYRTNADYEHGCHFTGLPTPVISGYTPEKEGEAFSIGSTTAWVFPRPDAKASYLEFTGQGLNSLEKNLTRKEQQMSILGARMLEPTQNNGASADGAAINAGGEQSILASISTAVSLGMGRALDTFAKFAGSTDGVTYRLNKDFFPMPMSALNLTALIAGWQNGAYNYETLFENLKRGEVVAIDKTVEEELTKMDQHKPVIPGGTKVNQDNAPRHETTLANPTQRQMQTP